MATRKNRRHSDGIHDTSQQHQPADWCHECHRYAFGQNWLMHIHAVMRYNKVVKYVFVLFVLVEICLISINGALFRYSI